MFHQVTLLEFKEFLESVVGLFTHLETAITTPAMLENIRGEEQIESMGIDEVMTTFLHFNGPSTVSQPYPLRSEP